MHIYKGRNSDISSIQFSSVAQSCPTLYDLMSHSNQASLSISNSQNSPKPMCIESVTPSSHLILYCSLLLLPSISPNIRIFSKALCIRWPKDWSFSPSNEYSGLISFRINWLDLLCCSGNSQESPLKPQFKSINSLALSLLYHPTLTLICDYWKNHSFDQMYML